MDSRPTTTSPRGSSCGVVVTSSRFDAPYSSGVDDVVKTAGNAALSMATNINPVPAIFRITLLVAVFFIMIPADQPSAHLVDG